MPSIAGIASRPPTWAARLTALARLVHPFPSLLNAAVVGALACVAARGWPGLGTTASLVATMLTIQCSIGALNDWADRSLDATTKPTKPIAAGLVSPAIALTLAIALALLAALLATGGGAAAWLVAMAGLTVGVAYDLGVKRTPFSALTYAVALPLIPLWVWTAMGSASPALAAVAPVGFLLGLGLQLANALPDAVGDEAAGVRGTLQWLGPTRGRRAAWLAYGGALALSVLLAPLVGLRTLPFAAGWLAAAVLWLAAIALYRRRPSRHALQQGWSMLAPAAGLLAVGWFASLR